MPEAIDASMVERFRAVVEARTGLSFVPGKTDDLLDLLRQRTHARATVASEYLSRLELGDVRDELRELAPLLTVGETYFFRNPSQFDAFRALAQQHMTQPETAKRPLRVLSAGCASGEEAYSLVIAAREVFAASGCTVSVAGLDLNPRVLERARKARYSEWSLRALPDEIRARWFRNTGNEITLDPSLLNSVNFCEGNLVHAGHEFFSQAQWDVIFCRNALMYFSPDKARHALANLTRALHPLGHLFLGHAETLRGLSSDYHLCHTHEAFYYQQRGAQEPARVTAPVVVRQPWAASPPVSAEPNTDLFASIDRATERVRGLGTANASAVAPRLAARELSRDLAPVLDLMQSDRHSEALALFSSTIGSDLADADQLLVEATLLTHGNRFAAAEVVCNQLLVLDELSAGAHYVLALCREAAGDTERALHHDQVAAYLDPCFAMPHLHMGLLLRRTGQHDSARAALAQARALLEREDTARLAMFGGGFGRSALLALCAASPVL